MSIITEAREAIDTIVIDHGGKRFRGRGAKERRLRWQQVTPSPRRRTAQ